MITAFDIGGTKMLAGDYDHAGALIASRKTESPKDDYAEFLDVMIGQVPENATAIGVSIAGVVDLEQGRVNAANLPCLSGQSFVADIESVTNCPVYLINDANAFGLAEATYGAGKGCGTVFAAIIGTGLGGALIFDGKLHVGKNGGAGEWGHGRATLNPEIFGALTIQCGCGQTNCLDLFGGARGLERINSHLQHGDVDSVTILKRWENGETETVNTYLEIMGNGLAQIINFADPDIVVLGGGLSNNWLLMRALEVETQKRSLCWDAAGKFVQALCGADAGLLGAMIYARSQQPKR